MTPSGSPFPVKCSAFKEGKLKKRSFLLVLLLLSVLIVPIGVMAQDANNVLRIPINPDPEHLNPFTATTIAIGTINRNIFEGLTRFDPDSGQVEPLLAESWDISDDQLTYTFHLRHGVMFHEMAGVTYDDGDREFKADDWVWAATLSASGDEKVSQHPEWVESVVGAKDVTDGTATEISRHQAD